MAHPSFTPAPTLLVQSSKLFETQHACLRLMSESKATRSLKEVQLLVSSTVKIQRCETETLVVVAGKDFTPLPTKTPLQTMKSPVSSLTEVLTPKQQNSAQANLCLDSSDEMNSISSYDDRMLCATDQQIHGKRLFAGPDKQNDQCSLTEHDDRIIQKLSSQSSSANNTPISETRITAVSKSEVKSRKDIPNSSSCPPDSKQIGSPCFWDWLAPSKRKDSAGHMLGEESYDPSTVLIPNYIYDQMTGYDVFVCNIS